MKANMFIGIMLIAFGIVALAYRGIHGKSHERPLNLDAVPATTEKTGTFPLLLLVGGIALTGGILLLVRGNKRGWWERA